MCDNTKLMSHVDEYLGKVGLELNMPLNNLWTRG